jgi:hypothetical protein
MQKKSYESVTLDNLNQGAVKELFEAAWERMMNNIGDPNTSPTATRTLTLKITVKPDENRESATTEVGVTTSLAQHKPHKSSILLDGEMGGHVTAAVSVLKQPELPEVPGNTRPIKGAVNE